MMKNISKKKRWAIAMALAAGTILPPFSGAVSAADKEIATNGSAPEAGGSANTDSTATVEGNTLTLKSGVTYTGQLYGGLHLGSGDVKGNTLKIEPSATLRANGYGGFVDGGLAHQKGSALSNHAIFDGGATGEIGDIVNPRNLVGGETRAREGSAIENTVEMKSGKVYGDVCGGVLNHGDAAGTLKGNEVTMKDGEVRLGLYGGYSYGKGTATLNKVTVEKGTVGNDGLCGAYVNVGVGDAVTENTVTMKGDTSTTHIHGKVVGGFIESGNGNVKNNHVVIEGGKADNAVIGGETKGSGQAIGNTVTMKGDSEVGAIVGGYSDKTTGEVKGNKVTLNGGKVLGEITGGIVDANGSGNAIENEVTVNSGEVTGAVYGGATSGGGKALKNTVTITGGKLHDVYGGFTDAAASETTGNTVNLGDGEHAMAAGYQIGKISGGNHADVTGNTLNVKTNVEAENIANFETLRFHKNASVTNANPLLSLTGGVGTTIKSLQKIETVGDFLGKYTLLQNSNGITISEGGNRHTVTKEKTEHILQKDGSGQKILYEGYQFKEAQKKETATTGDQIFGGRSLLGNTTMHNTLTVEGGTHTNAYGGKTEGTGTTAPDKGNSRGNTATLKGGTVNRLTGGYTDANGGKATANNVFIEGGTVNGDVRGGNADGILGTGNDATGNTVTVTGGTVNGALYGGYSANGKSTGNTVTLGDGRNALASAALSNADLYGGNDADKTDNILNVKTNVTVKSVQNFSKINFENNASVNAANPMLKVTGGANTTFDSLSKISADENLLGERTLVENLSGITIADGKNQYGISKEKTEHLLENNGTQLRSLGYQFKGAEVTHNANVTGDLYGGRSELGNSTVGNRLTITGGAITGSVHGGYTKTPGTEAGSDKGDSRQNTVTLKNGTVSASVFGGYVFGGTGQVTGNKVRIQGGAVTGFVVGGQNDGTGSAKDNEVTVEGGSVHEIIGGLASSGDASENTVDLGAVTVNGNVTGGKSSGAGKTNNNTIHLRGTTVSGIVRGGSAANGTGNTLVVHSRAGGSTIGDFSGIQNLHFYVENDAVSATSPMLRLSGVNAKNITGIGIGVGVSGAAKVLDVGESIRLLQTASGSGLTTDAAIQNQITGDHGSSVRYKFDIKKAPGDPTALIATVKEKEMKEQTKSYVETRAALTDFVNHGGDILAGESLSAAKRAAKSAQGNANMERYQVWAGMGGSALRAESGSHVDTNGWNLHVGWARQDTTKSGQTLFSPFVEYGRGSYDSYVDDNAHITVHGSGTVSYFGLGLLARAERKGGLWYEGSIRGGRATSDYQSRLDSKDITYDGSNPYYAAHLGLGKDIKVKGEDTVTPYLRYFYTHQNGMTATLSSGEVYDFGSVNSHRVRLGFQYTHKVSESNEFYTGLAYEYEFNGETTATFQGYSTPSPSLKGSSGMLELGYRFTPTDGSLSYDLHFTGWQGIRRGFSGGAQITWGF